MEVRKEFAFILLSFLTVFFSCATPQTKPPTSVNDYSIDVTIYNNTFFDLEILDESRIIPRLSEKIITLPAFSGELNNGYPVVYRVPLMDDIFIKLARDENIIIKNDQRIAFIEKADFHLGLCYLVLKNYGKHTISLKNGDDYLNSLVGVNPNIYSSSPYLSPGNTYLYELKPGNNELLIETDQYRSIGFPLKTTEPCYIYTFLFDGDDAILIDKRSLREIGKNEKAILNFDGYPLSMRDRQIITDGFRYALQTWDVPLEPDINSMFGFLFTITISIRESQPLPSINTTTYYQANTDITFFINGKLQCKVNLPAITEMSEPILIRRISDQFKSEQIFFSNVNSLVKP
jgi:hypothetical protein